MPKVNFGMAAIGSCATYATAEHKPNTNFGYEEINGQMPMKNPCHEEETKDECYACCSPKTGSNPGGQVSTGALVARERSTADRPSKQAYVVMPMTCLLVDFCTNCNARMKTHLPHTQLPQPAANVDYLAWNVSGALVTLARSLLPCFYHSRSPAVFSHAFSCSAPAVHLESPMPRPLPNATALLHRK